METLKKKEQQGSKCLVKPALMTVKTCSDFFYRKVPVIPKWVSQKKQGVVKNGAPAQVEKIVEETYFSVLGALPLHSTNTNIGAGLCTPESNRSSIVLLETEVYIIIDFARRLSQRVGGDFKSLPAPLFLLKPWIVSI